MNEFTPFPESTLRAIIDNGYSLLSKDNDYIHTISSAVDSVFVTSCCGLYLKVKPEQISFRGDTLRITDRGEVFDFQITKEITITINDIGSELV